MSLTENEKFYWNGIFDNMVGYQTKRLISNQLNDSSKNCS